MPPSHFIRLVVVAALALCAVASLSFAGDTSTTPHPRALVVSIDGLMPAYYLEAEALGVPLPNLSKFLAAGAFAMGVEGVMPTTTYPSHVTLMTGVPPRVHGIVSNRVFDPRGTKTDAWYWHAKDIRVPTLISAARGKGFTTAAISWPTSIGLAADFNMPEYWGDGELDIRFVDSICTPGLLESVGDARGRPVPSFSSMTDLDRTDVAAWVIEHHRPEVMLMHLFDLDMVQHTHGPMTPQALAALRTSDQHLGRLLDSLETAGVLDSTLIAVVSDHGFLPVHTKIKPNVWLAEAGIIRLDEAGHVKSWKARFHSDAGTASLHLRDPKDRRTLEVVRKLVASRASSPDSGIDQILDAKTIERLGGDAVLALDGSDGYWFSDVLGGAWSEPSSEKEGQHGYAPSRIEMQTGLLLMGPGVRSGSLGLVRLTSIAPTIAQHLGIQLDKRADTPIDIKSKPPKP